MVGFTNLISPGSPNPSTESESELFSSTSSSSTLNDSNSSNCSCCESDILVKSLLLLSTSTAKQAPSVQQVNPSDFHKTIIIGAGPSSIALAARLREKLPAALYTDLEHARLNFLRRGRKKAVVKGLKRTIVENFPVSSNLSVSSMDIKIFDSTSSSWLGRWNNYFSGLEITHLRSPLFFHPSPENVDSLLAFSHREGRENELNVIDGVVGQEISKNIRKKKIKALSSHSSSQFTSRDHNPINERSRQDYFTPSTSLFSSFCQKELISRYSLDSLISKQTVTSLDYSSIHVSGEGIKDGFYLKMTDENGLVSTCGAETVVLSVGIGNKGNENLPEFLFDSNEVDRGVNEGKGWFHSSKFSEEVFDFPTKELKEKIARGEEVKMVVVGGGLTSAQIVELALRKGVTKVILVCRHQLKVSHFDFPLIWISKYSNLLKHTFFNEESFAARLRIVKESKNGGSITSNWMKVLKSRVKEGRLNLLEGQKLDSGKFDPITQSWNLKLKSVVANDKNFVGKDSTILENIDYIIFSTGFSPHFTKLPFLSTLIHSHPIETISGYPILTEDLQWNKEIPIFVIGAYALLQLGPDALNLGGSRNAAERVAQRMSELENEREERSNESNEGAEEGNTRVNLKAKEASQRELMAGGDWICN